MGKIFDALEKSDSEVSKAVPLVQFRKEAKDGAISNEERVVSLSSAKTIHADIKMDPNLITYHAPQSIEADLFKVLRTNLLFPSSGKVPRTILVTSALPGEGKSFVSANLAISIAQGVEEYVMLMDCDVRRPMIHNYFGFGQTNGISEHLASGIDIKKLLVKTPVPKLTIFPAGKPPKNPAELLSSKRMKALLKEVTTRYDDRFIIIDSPPPSMAAETNAIINFVDGVILVVKAGKTPRKAVTEIIEQIGKEKIIGSVLNYSEKSVKKYYGYGKSYYQ